MLVHASVMDDTLSVVPIAKPRRGRGSRAKCSCCGHRVTHRLFAAGVCMGWAGCEMYVWRCKRAIERQRGHR